MSENKKDNPKEDEAKKVDNLESDIIGKSISYNQLVFTRFKRHKLAVGASIFLIICYTVAIFAGFFAPHSAVKLNEEYPSAPPMNVRHFEKDGTFHLFPFVYKLESRLDDDTWEKIYEETDQIVPIKFFVKGERSYKILGLFESKRHLFGTSEEQPVFLWGTDSLGRDMFSRIIWGSQISLSIGLVGVAISMFLGLLIGGLSGYFGGIVDTIIQRVIEVLISLPTIPLWMALSAALPRDWTQIQRYMGITVLLSILGWTGIARTVRSKFLSLRNEDYVKAATVMGSSNVRIIFKHLIPNYMSYVIVVATLAIPRMILGETSLSFLGLGLKDPIVSWGVLLQSAQNITAIANQYWLLFPAFAVICVVLAFNFMGDGLRDAVDPHAK